jgi:GT2 family glycosyltransferase
VAKIDLLSGLVVFLSNPPKDTIPKVAILVLNFNGKRWLRDCFSSLRTMSYPNFEVYLVDNASTDDSVEYTRREFPWVEVIRHDRNYGFCDGYNRAIRMINAEFILLLNNDTIIGSPEWLMNIMRIIGSSPEISVVGAKLLLANSSMHTHNIIDSVGGRVFRWTGPVAIGSKEIDYGQYDFPSIMRFYVSGAAMLIRRDAFLEVGGFDPKMFAYSEDVDLCWRLRLRGYSIGYCPEAVVYHVFSGSWRELGSAKIYFSCRNFLRTILKNYSLSSILENLPFYLINTLFRGVGASFLLRKPIIFSDIFKGIFWNLVNLKDTIVARYNVQTSRRVSEERILHATEDRKCESISDVLQRIRYERVHGRNIT